MTFEQRSRDCLKKGILGRGNTKCIDSVWVWPAYSWKSVGLELSKWGREWQEMRLERRLTARSWRVFRMMDFTLCVVGSHWNILHRGLTWSVLKGSLWLYCTEDFRSYILFRKFFSWRIYSSSSPLGLMGTQGSFDLPGDGVSIWFTPASPAHKVLN